MKENTIALDELSMQEIQQVMGENDINIRIIETYFHVSIVLKNNIFEVNGDEAENAICALNSLLEVFEVKKSITESDVRYSCSLAESKDDHKMASLYDVSLAKNYSGKLIYPKTFGQKTYIDALMKSDIVFGIGPAGSGKTYLAVVYAVSLLKKNAIKRIVLTRPAVEAGESLGFLPGDLKDKVDPYLRPLYDALFDMLGEENTEKMIEKGIIEIAPLAYMRGRTLNDAYVILDEAQNTTKSQMKMFLTRLGFHSQMAITGDISQIDLPSGKKSGLVEAVTILKDVEGISIISMKSQDVVRHPLVTRIIDCYERNEVNEKENLKAK